MDSQHLTSNTVARPDISGRAFKSQVYTTEAIADAAVSDQAAVTSFFPQKAVRIYQSFTEGVRHTPLVSTEALGRVLLCLAPSLVMLVALTFFAGTGKELTKVFLEYKWRYPEIKKIVGFGTSYGMLFFHIPMLSFLYRAVRCKDWFVVRVLLVYLAAQVFIAFFIVHTLKIIMGIPRPLPAFYDGAVPKPFSFANDYNSFPSGHSTEAMGAAGTLSVWFKNVWVTLLCGIWTSCLAFTRIFLCQHSIPDILAGLVLGSLTALAVNYYYRRSRT